MNTPVYYELLGRMIEAYDQAPNDDNPLMTIQMFARIAADYIEGRRIAQMNLPIINDALPDITGGTGNVDADDEPDECEEADPLDQIESPDIVPTSDEDVARAEYQFKKCKYSENEGGVDMTAKPNVKSIATLDIQFSEREREIMDLMKEHPEFTAKQIASVFDLAIGSVYAYQHSIRKKISLMTPKKVTNG